MRKVAVLLSLAFAAIAFSPIAMPAGALVTDGVSVPTEVTAPDAEATLDSTVETVGETLEPAAPVTEPVKDVVKKVTGKDIDDVIDPTDDGTGEGDGDGDATTVDDTSRDTSSDSRDMSDDSTSSSNPASVTSTAPAAAPQELPRPAALRGYVAKTPAPVADPAPVFIEHASSDSVAAAIPEPVKKASKITLGVLQIVALLMVVGMLSAEFLYGMRRIGRTTLRA